MAFPEVLPITRKFSRFVESPVICQTKAIHIGTSNNFIYHDWIEGFTEVCPCQTFPPQVNVSMYTYSYISSYLYNTASIYITSVLWLKPSTSLHMSDKFGWFTKCCIWLIADIGEVCWGMDHWDQRCHAIRHRTTQGCTVKEARWSASS